MLFLISPRTSGIFCAFVKKYWLAPLIITIVLMGALIVFTQGSVVAPFIYSIF